MLRGKALGIAAAIALPLAMTATGASAQNLFGNASFEEPVTPSNPTFFGVWESFSADNNQAEGPDVARNSDVMPRTGAQHLELAIDNTANTFAGVFQDAPVTPGTEATFSVYAKALAGSNIGPEMRIEWRDEVGEVGRTPNFVPTLTEDYTLVELIEMVPANATTARAVFAVQTFGLPDPAGAPTGTIFLDDASFVPEPASLALLGLGGLAALSRRRA